MEQTFGRLPELLLFGMIAAGANVVGGLVLIKAGAHRFGERLLKYLVALGAGFMLAAIFIEILPETVGLWTDRAFWRKRRGGRGRRHDATARRLSGHSALRTHHCSPLSFSVRRHIRNRSCGPRRPTQQ